VSEIKATDQSIINSEDDVFDLYLGAGSESKAGIEVELSFLDPAANKPMSLAQNRLLKNAAQARHEGDWLRNEPTAEVMEVTSIPGAADEVKTVLGDTTKKIKILSDKAHELGLKRSWFQELPDKTGKGLLEHIIDVERYKIFYQPYRKDMTGIVTYFAVCKSDQVSVSYKDPAHMLKNVRRLYFMAPFLFLVTDNSSGFNQGQPFTGHQGMMHRTALGDKGGVPPYLFTAQSGEEYISAHIQHVMNNPLFMYYDEKGTLTRIPSGTWSSFKQLRGEGLNTVSNYFLAQSLLWPDVEIAQLKNDDGDVTGHRYEARMFGTGLHQYQSAFLMTTELAFNPAFAQDVDALLVSYGFDSSDLPATKRHLEAAYDSAREHDGAFFDIAYGTGSMADFAKAFADLIENAFIGRDLDDELEPLLSICRSGCTDGKVNRLMFPTLEETLAFQKNYDPALLDNPNSCAHMIFEKKVQRETSRPCSSIAA